MHLFPHPPNRWPNHRPHLQTARQFLIFPTVTHTTATVDCAAGRGGCDGAVSWGGWRYGGMEAAGLVDGIPGWVEVILRSRLGSQSDWTMVSMTRRKKIIPCIQIPMHTMVTQPPFSSLHRISVRIRETPIPTYKTHSNPPAKHSHPPPHPPLVPLSSSSNPSRTT